MNDKEVGELNYVVLSELQTFPIHTGGGKCLLFLVWFPRGEIAWSLYMSATIIDLHTEAKSRNRFKGKKKKPIGMHMHVSRSWCF